MRILVLSCLSLAPLFGHAQFETPWSLEERLNIELVPVLVIDEQTAIELISEGEDAITSFGLKFVPLFSRMFSATQEAMHLLGVFPHEYTLVHGEEVHFLFCDEATVITEQTCGHMELDYIDDLPNFVYNLHNGEARPIGTFQLYVLLLQDRMAWRGVLGLAWRWWWRVAAEPHWNNTACRAWALHSIPVIAHELGHCFGLDHNEDDTDTGLDLMTSHYSHYRWVKESNKEIVRDRFRYPPPLQSVPTGQAPIVELHY